MNKTADLKTLFRFKKHSKLSEVFIKESDLPQGSNYIELEAIVKFLEKKITKENLRSPDNPEVIIFSSDLRKIFGTEACHHGSLLSLLLEELIQVTGYQSIEIEEVPSTFPHKKFDDFTISEETFMPTWELQLLLNKLDSNGSNDTQSRNKTYHFDEIVDTITKFIMINKEDLMDTKSQIINVKNHYILRTIFKTSYLHISQLPGFIQEAVSLETENNDSEGCIICMENGSLVTFNHDVYVINGFINPCEKNKLCTNCAVKILEERQAKCPFCRMEIYGAERRDGSSIYKADIVRIKKEFTWIDHQIRKAAVITLT